MLDPIFKQLPQEILNEIKQIIEDLGNKRGESFLIVEGSKDKRLFSSFLNKKCIQYSTNGRENLDYIYKKLQEKSINGFIAIKDADFSRIKGTIKDLPNLFYTDYHDLEMMIICSPALDKFLNNFSTSSKIRLFLNTNKHESILLALFDNGKYLGYLRYLSEESRWGLNFDSIDEYKKLFSKAKDSFTLDLKKTVEFLIEKSNNNLSALEVTDKINEFAKEEHALKEICCGHDLTAILAFIFWEYLHMKDDRKESYTPGHTERILYSSYDFDYFKKSSLYKDIVLWENDNQPFSIFKKSS